MLEWLLFTFLLILLGFWLIRRGQATYARTGLPVGDIVYHDTGAWEKVERTLINRQYGLIGKPDYLVQVTEQGRSWMIPVEVKSANRPLSPHVGHVLQLATYCLLVEATYAQTPPYGLLRYANATLRIPFTAALRQEVLAAAEAIRRDQRASHVKRSHHEVGRCRACGYQHQCGDQQLTA